MRHFFFSKIITPIFLLIIALPSSATIIVEGNLRAQVTEYHQYDGNHSDFGSPGVSTEILGSFAYSVEKNITGPLDESASAHYELSWMHAEFYIGGIYFNVAPNALAETSSWLSVQKRATDDWTDFEDMFSLAQEYVAKESSPWGPSRVNRHANIQVWGGVDDIGAAQDFSFPNGSDLGFPTYLRLYSAGYDSNNNYYQESLGASISNFTIASRTADVPESKMWMLCGIGFLSLVWRRLQSSTSA